MLSELMSFVNLVSIHLMLLFIKTRTLMEYKLEERFNTSHVTLYQFGYVYATLLIRFQYISCYSLSVNEPNSTLQRLSFNTSHVTLYPSVLFILFYFISFQYISCYSLSPVVKSLKRIYYEFQYISCYSLSLQQERKNWKLSCFNTSHVTLYPSFYRLFFF